MINWNIVSVDTETVAGRENAIIMARWICKASDAGKIGVHLGATSLGSPGANFIEFEDLTEADILGFCWDNGLDKSASEAKAETDLQTALAAPASPTLPWLVVEEETI